MLPSARRLAEHGVVADGERLPDPRRVGATPRALATAEHVEDGAAAAVGFRSPGVD